MPQSNTKRTVKRKMPKFKPASQATRTRFAEMIKPFPDAEQRQMFGYPCAFVNGQMFLGVFGDSFMLRLSPVDRATFLELPNARLFEPMSGRPMREYVQLTPEVLDSARGTKKWVGKGIAYARTLPPKKKKARPK
jgi:TfoX/Sxy family transcriptional regulator of competence genes